MSEGKQWNRREFRVTSAGYYTVLSPARWFSTLQLPGGYRYRMGEDGKPRRQLGKDASQMPSTVDATVSLRLVGTSEGRFYWVRRVLIVLAAIVLFCSVWALMGIADRLPR